MSNQEKSKDALKADPQEYACLLYSASLEWAETSFTKLYESEHPDQPYGDERHRSAQTVGCVCLSYALEFAYKALLLANDTWPKKWFRRPPHSIGKLHSKLPECQQAEIEALARECVETESYLGFDDTQTMTSILAGVDRMGDIQGIHVINLIDRYCANVHIKYLGYKGDLTFHDFLMPIIDTRRLDAISRLHRGILKLAYDRFDPEVQGYLSQVETLWPDGYTHRNVA